jgi:hypothetical protein
MTMLDIWWIDRAEIDQVIPLDSGITQDTRNYNVNI